MAENESRRRFLIDTSLTTFGVGSLLFFIVKSSYDLRESARIGDKIVQQDNPPSEAEVAKSNQLLETNQTAQTAGYQSTPQLEEEVRRAQDIIRRNQVFQHDLNTANQPLTDDMTLTGILGVGGLLVGLGGATIRQLRRSPKPNR